MAAKLLLHFLQSFLLTRAMSRLRRKGLLVYLKTLQIARKSLVAAFALFIVLQLMVFGLVGAIVTGIYLAPLDPEARLWVLFGVFAALFALPFFAVVILLSDRVWFRVSGAKDMLEAEGLKKAA